MSDLNKLRRWIGQSAAPSEPPAVREAPELGHEATVQLNLKVPRDLRRRLKKLAADEDRSMVALLRDMLDVYEHGLREKR